MRPKISLRCRYRYPSPLPLISDQHPHAFTNSTEISICFGTHTSISPLHQSIEANRTEKKNQRTSSNGFDFFCWSFAVSRVAVLDGFCCITFQFVTCQIFSYSFNKVICHFRNRNRNRGTHTKKFRVWAWENAIPTWTREMLSCLVFYSLFFLYRNDYLQ